MRLSELCRRAGIYFDPTREDAEITRITSDSGKMIPGGLFVALHGLKHDGDDFIADAREKGAIAVLSESDPGDLRTDDARLALARLCRAFYGEGIERLKLVGVTGTNGKTTIVSLLSSIARAAGKKCACIGTLGCRFVDSDGSEKELTGEGHMTTPDPEVLYLALSEAAGLGAEYAFIEVSSHALAMKRADALRFDVGIFTNLTRDHLDFHGTKEEYIRAKARLAPLCDSFVVNSDDPAAELVGREDSLTCSCREKADFYAGNIRPNGDIGRSYELVSPYGSFEADTRMPGDFSVMNTLEASAAALLLGFEKDSIREGIAGLSCVPGRMEPVALDGADFRVFIDYAHTPDALKKSLITARELAGAGRVILLFGCGGDRDRGKRKSMGSIATMLADLTVVTSDNPRSEPPEAIISEILRGVDREKPYTVICDRRRAIEYAIDEARAGDVVLLAGKGHEKYEIGASGTFPFDEAGVAREAFSHRRG